MLDPARIAALYRQLRKALEDGKDEPGAADFYYGEMEMRRNAKGSTSMAAERLIVTAYWLVSGYGLRASRALAAFAITVLVFGLGFYEGGIDQVAGKREPSLARAMFFSLESTISLFKAPGIPPVTLSYPGEAMQVALRLLGPLFFGLGLLSLRGPRQALKGRQMEFPSGGDQLAAPLLVTAPPALGCCS